MSVASMTYTLNFIGKFGLWELRVNNCRSRLFTSRYGAERLIARYRQMLQSEQNRYDRAEERERDSFAEMRYESAKECR